MSNLPKQKLLMRALPSLITKSTGASSCATDLLALVSLHQSDRGAALQPAPVPPVVGSTDNIPTSASQFAAIFSVRPRIMGGKRF